MIIGPHHAPWLMGNSERATLALLAYLTESGRRKRARKPGVSIDQRSILPLPTLPQTTVWARTPSVRGKEGSGSQRRGPPKLMGFVFKPHLIQQ